jgi:hypothetical protein
VLAIPLICQISLDELSHLQNERISKVLSVPTFYASLYPKNGKHISGYAYGHEHRGLKKLMRC